MKKKQRPERLTISQIEDLLEREEDIAIRILPNGEIIREDGGKDAPKPLTMRERLGGEYAI